MNITLSPEQEKFIQSQIARGNYQDVEQVIKEALTILEIINQENDQKRLEELKEKIALGLEDVKQGNVTDGELVFERLQERLRSEFGLKE
ncbi:MAG: type II toxin-antitoxin system ParD family antitoxin [Crocosphaera sp.]